MRTLLISTVAASLMGCTCLVPPHATSEGTDDKGFACFVQSSARPSIAPNQAFFEPDPVTRKTKVATLSKIDIPASTRRAEKSDPVTRKPNTMTSGKMETAASTPPANKADSGTKTPRFTIHKKVEAKIRSQPAKKPGSVLPQPNSTIPVKMEAPESTQPADKTDPVLSQAKSSIPANPPASYTTDHILRKAMTTIAAKMEDPFAEFSEMKRAVRKNTLGKPIDTVCGYVKGKNTSGGDAGERPFLYLVEEDEAYIVDGSSDMIAETAYRNICN